jgi:hypothetical protein
MRRQTKAGQTPPIQISDNVVSSLPIYLKLKRSGAGLSFQRSADGTNFTEVGTREIGTGQTQVNLTSDTLVGVATTGGGGGSTRVDYREVRFPPLNPSFQPTPAGPTFRRGDADASRSIDLTDAITVLSFLFLGGQVPQCVDAADFDDSGEVDITDAISNLNYQYLGGEAPPDPGPTNCGADKNQEPDQGKPELGCKEGCP